MYLPRPLYIAKPYVYFGLALLGFNVAKVFPILCGVLLFVVGLKILHMRSHAKQTWKFD